MCQAGICQPRGTLIGPAGQDPGAREWQGSRCAFCALTAACWDRQAQVLEFWKYKTGAALK
eukprot:9584933-Lingulodinium_polyedra.AAC.1